MFEATFVSAKKYADPFNDVDVDVIFSDGSRDWRVPAFWEGDQRWSVRFAPPSPGEYTYRLESTDPANRDLNGYEDRVVIAPYSGSNQLLARGALRVSDNCRYFQHADGTPFYWFADTWYSGLSDRVPWSGFCMMTSDRRAKGYTVVLMAVMTVSNEEDAPFDPGYFNEGGCVWEGEFERLNPRYFDFADRRVRHLIDAGIVPALVGAWRQELKKMGVEKMKKLWRYIIARYGAYPVFWIGGGEVYDPPADCKVPLYILHNMPYDVRVPGWTDVVRHIRAIDPYGHPVTVHECPPPYDMPLQDEALTDFDLFQPSHFGAASIAGQVAQLNMHYARTTVRKPLIVGEICWETLAGQHMADSQRAAFWLAMVNGAAGFSYGNIVNALAYSLDKPFHRARYSLLNWQEGMNLPGASQVALGANLLRQYDWHRCEPHPEWITPRGTTILEPRTEIDDLDIDFFTPLFTDPWLPETALPSGEWQNRMGTFRLPYAMGIPRELRIIYIPLLGFSGALKTVPPTVLELEADVRYRAYYWEPSLGVKFDLGIVQRPDEVGDRLLLDEGGRGSLKWILDDGKSMVLDNTLELTGTALATVHDFTHEDAVVSVDVRPDSDAAVVLRHRDASNYVAARYSPAEKAIYFLDRRESRDGQPLGRTAIPAMTTSVRLTVEARGGTAIMSVTDGGSTITSPIVDIHNLASGALGLQHRDAATSQHFRNFEVRESVAFAPQEHLERTLHDAYGNYRGELAGRHWQTYGMKRHVLLNAYRPERMPFPHDWVLVLEAQ
jgi:hypothetical protein